MDPSYSSGDISNIKTRKPYTITKQRERWTEDEHNSFLEALKLYGRAWQRIEEHIGTKTAVQIRSHAQKFFTKLEKEALAKGVPTRQALDMEIPPPRPKRKPNYPYPRKTGSKTHPKDANQPSLVSSLQSGIDLERKPLPETEKEEIAKTSEQVENEEEAPCASSENENTMAKSVAGVFREFIPSMEDVTNHEQDSDTIKQTSNTLFDFPEGQTCMQNYPRHVPVQVVDGNQGQGITAKNSVPVTVPAPVPVTPQESSLDKSEVFNIAAASGTNNGSRSSNYQTIPTFHPLFTPLCDNQENYRSFLHVSSTISSLIVSSLLQNPAAHAAANFAATFWNNPSPEAAAAAAGDSSSREHEAPSMAAIAAATVAAATAWWAAHGLLPVCTPFYPGYSTCTSPVPFGPPVNGNQTKVEENGDVKKIIESSSDDSDGKLDTEPNVNVNDGIKEMTPVVELTTGQKQVDRSSCGSNTTSSSDIETDALEKHGKEKEETKVADVNDSVSRSRVRTAITPNESWKEVSEEGRLAFQALFSREVLPQSFSNRQTGEFDLNQMNCPSLRNEKNVKEGLLTIGLGNVKLNVHHTGFKPYKRCSIEAKENTKNTSTGACQNDEKDPKRMRLEAEAST